MWALNRAATTATRAPAGNDVAGAVGACVLIRNDSTSGTAAEQRPAFFHFSHAANARVRLRRDPMLGSISQRLLTLLQLTRMALVFTAIADGLCTLLLAARARAGTGGSLAAHVSAAQVFWAMAVSVGLYGFGMSLNDIIDRRRDLQIAASRPLPSGRIGVTMAHVVCTVLLLLA